MQAATKRGDLVQELLSQGPPLTAHPEAVGPDSWADLLAAGKSSAPAAAPSVAVATPPAAARRLSNPAQEASAFAAEGLAANADALDVHHVLVQRLAAAGAAVQAASSSGASPGSAEVRNALAEAALYRGEACSIEALFLLQLRTRRNIQQSAVQRQPTGPLCCNLPTRLCCLPALLLLQRASCRACSRSWRQLVCEQSCSRRRRAAAAAGLPCCSCCRPACRHATQSGMARRQHSRRQPLSLQARQPQTASGRPLLPPPSRRCGAACGSSCSMAAAAARAQSLPTPMLAPQQRCRQPRQLHPCHLLRPHRRLAPAVRLQQAAPAARRREPGSWRRPSTAPTLLP